MGVAYNSRITTDGLVLCLDAANTKSYPTKNFVSSKIYSSFGSSIRSSNYTVQYSDDNSNWTTAFTGVASNNTSCGIQQNTGSGSGSYGLHRYWRYVEGSPIQSHHPRVSRIILTDINGIDYNLVVYTSDNCSDTGTYQVGTVSLDFGGTTWTDLSGRGNTGTLNGVGYSASNGGSLTFDGSDDYVLVSSNASIPYGSTARTVSIWFYTNTTTWASNVNNLFYYGAGSDGASFGIDFSTYPSMEVFTWGSGTNDFLFSTTYSQVGWKNITVTYNGATTILIYENGVFTQTFTLPSVRNTTTSDVYIGAINPNILAGYYDGNIAQVSIYNRALSAAEVSQNFNALRGRFGI